MEELQAELDRLLSRLSNSDEVRQRLINLVSVYPFSKYEYMISVLLGEGVLSLDSYYSLRVEYTERNPYLWLFDQHAPRHFGERWAQEHLGELVPNLDKPSKKTDIGYKGQYDFLLDSKIRIEVKASRAVASETRGSLTERALSIDSKSKFDMNFQQIKPRYCDVFVWIGVWRDRIRYWVLSSQEVETNRSYSDKQHRGNTGEGQLHIKESNISAFETFEKRPDELAQAIRDAYIRQVTSTGNLGQL